MKKAFTPQRTSDTKKVKLDEFVKDFQKSDDKADARRLFTGAQKTLADMNKIFTNGDPLLKNIGTIVAYFLVFQRAAKEGELKKLTRKRFLEFEVHREENAIKAAKDISEAEYDFLKFDELTGTINDEYAIRFRCRLISKFVLSDDSKTAQSFPDKT
jgi:hypothetical protein